MFLQLVYELGCATFSPSYEEKDCVVYSCYFTGYARSFVRHVSPDGLNTDVSATILKLTSASTDLLICTVCLLLYFFFSLTEVLNFL